MKRIRMTPLFFRRIHKWVGLVLGIQFILWSISGSMMAALDSDAVGGHGGPQMAAPAIPAQTGGALVAPASLAVGAGAESVVLRGLGPRPVYEVRGGGGTQLFDAADGSPIPVDEELVRDQAAMVSAAPIRAVSTLDGPNLESRDFAGRMWRVDFADEENTSAYFAADNARFLVARGDTWRWWDFFWMLHNMDYLNRTSFNHPVIIAVAFGVLFLSGTGFYLLFKSFTRRDFKWLRLRH